MDREQIEAILKKHKNDECSTEEIQALESWLFSINKQNITEIDQQDLKEVISKTKLMLDESIDAHERKITSNKHIKSISYFYLGIAAIFAVIVSCSALLFINRGQIYDHLYPIKYTTVATTVGKRSRVELLDGTVVWLNFNSSLTFNNRYNKDSRDVILQGEAFFEVKKGVKPFYVKTGKLTTKVLGTSFNIQAYASAKNIDVALLTGKIWLKTAGRQSSILVPNQSVIFDKSTGKLGSVHNEQTSDRAAWKEGTFIFNDTPLYEVLERLKRAYTLDFDVQDKQLLKLKFNGRFNMNEPAKEIIASICRLIDAKYTIQKDKVIIK